MKKKSINLSKLKDETNFSVYNKIKRQVLSCSFCKPNKGENRDRQDKTTWKRKRKTKYRIIKNVK